MEDDDCIFPISEHLFGFWKPFYCILLPKKKHPSILKLARTKLLAMLLLYYTNGVEESFFSRRNFNSLIINSLLKKY